MNTNNNLYTVIYTTIIVVVVAAVLSFVSQSLKSRQEANIKAETLRQMMAAAQIKPADELYATANADILQLYADNIAEAYTIGLDGQKNGSLEISKDNIQLVDKLKPQNRGILNGGDVTLPVYIFKSDVAVIPIYGAGLWGPVWGYIAVDETGLNIVGAYFDHASETPGLGGKIKDDPAFRAQFEGKALDFADAKTFSIVKGGAPEGKANAIDAISGATMTSKGLDEAINVWIDAYQKYLTKAEEE